MSALQTDATAPSAAEPGCCAGTLLRVVQPVTPDVRVAEILEQFTAVPELIAIPVVEQGLPVGLINRKHLIERFARPYTRELFGRKPVSTFMDAHPLIVDAHTDLDDLSRIIIESDMHYLYDGFIITREDRYAGMGTGHDLIKAITERKQAHLYRLAHYDALTTLPNRLLFLDRLSQALGQARRNNRLAAVMLLDFDRFKAINDTFGHTAGDELLRTIGRRIVECVREDDTVARLSGDEFTILLPNIQDRNNAAVVAQKVLDNLQRPFSLNGHEVFITTSIGIALYPDGEDSETLLKQADTAMYKVKEFGGNAYKFFSVEMTMADLRRLSLETQLRKAIERQELTLHYQPQAEISSGVIFGAEALLRWQHPELGVVTPSEFIPLAEETGLIVPLGEWVLHTACAQNRAWQDAGLPALRVAVNLSSRQFRQGNLADIVLAALEAAHLDSRWLELELTESVLMQDTHTTSSILNGLSRIGVHLSVDDFGTGYSSLNYLKRFTIDMLKIDQSFVRDITTDRDDTAIVSAIIAMSHSLGIKAIAEGVETDAQLSFLCQKGCDAIQGFCLSRPLPVTEFEHFLRQTPRRPLTACC